MSQTQDKTPNCIISQPSHYIIKDNIEVIDVREWWLEAAAECEAFTPAQISHLERATEYLLRAPRKDKMTDVKKAYQYLHRALYGQWPSNS